ncbi:hypothetical protein PIB30_007406 [Stylosanthes scabra]|uniref:Uncharacterized protein n=1 Tax=Stylosanthes scabra TaxID=79078 RepID=A0ABU6Q5E1_9FABA|nr:hypothetical protein [Stylosanthes scabra]
MIIACYWCWIIGSPSLLKSEEARDKTEPPTTPPFLLAGHVVVAGLVLAGHDFACLVVVAVVSSSPFVSPVVSPFVSPVSSSRVRTRVEEAGRVEEFQIT